MDAPLLRPLMLPIAEEVLFRPLKRMFEIVIVENILPQRMTADARTRRRGGKERISSPVPPVENPSLPKSRFNATNSALTRVNGREEEKERPHQQQLKPRKQHP